MWEGVGEYGRMWEGVGEYGRMWEDVGGSGREWMGVGRMYEYDKNTVCKEDGSGESEQAAHVQTT